MMTIQEINDKRLLLAQITLGGDDKTNVAADKLNYAIEKLKKRFDRATKPVTEAFIEGPGAQFNEAMDDLRVKYAAVYPDDFEAKEKRGLLLKDENGQHIFSQKSTMAFNLEARPLLAAFKKEQEALSQQEVELPGDNFLASSDWPRVDEVSLFIREELAGLLFAPEAVPAMVVNMNKLAPAPGDKPALAPGDAAVAYAGDAALENGGEAPKADGAVPAASNGLTKSDWE